MNGTDLLAEFRATRAEAAFSELVRRYTNLVYSIAKRRVADMTLAQAAVENGDLGTAIALLDAHRPAPGQRD